MHSIELKRNIKTRASNSVFFFLFTVLSKNILKSLKLQLNLIYYHMFFDRSSSKQNKKKLRMTFNDYYFYFHFFILADIETLLKYTSLWKLLYKINKIIISYCKKVGNTNKILYCTIFSYSSCFLIAYAHNKSIFIFILLFLLFASGICFFFFLDIKRLWYTFMPKM